MKLGINLLSAHSGGGVSASIHFLEALSKVKSDANCVVFISGVQTDLLPRIPKSFRVVSFPFNSKSWLTRFFLDQVVLPVYVVALGLSALYSLNTVSVLAPCRLILSFENANPFSQVNFSWSWRQRLRNQLLKYFGLLSMRRAHAIRFLADNSRAILCRFFAIPAAKTRVIPHGWVAMGSLKHDLAFDGKSASANILYVSNIGPYKNTHRLMRAFDSLVSRDGLDYSLLIIGEAVCPKYYDEVLRLKKDLPSGNRIQFTGKLPYLRLRDFYERAKLVCYPSLEETFGLPILEALSMGIPVAASDCKNLPGAYFNPFQELFGDTIHYFNPLDVVDIARVIRVVLRDSSARERAGAAGALLEKKYNWGAIANDLYDLCA